MTLFDIIMLAIALAMDCFTVSIVSGVIKTEKRSAAPCASLLSSRRSLSSHFSLLALRMALLFGFFQAFMPLLGWLGISYFSRYLEAIDHWIAFTLLAIVGGNMIREALGNEEEQHFNPSRLRTQLILAVATSIDALAIGISFACTGYDRLSLLWLPLAVIGVVSFGFSIAGYVLGMCFGRSIARRLKPELLGGIILILIGLKILITHLMGLE